MTPMAVNARELMRRAILTLRAVSEPKGPKEFGNAFANLIVHEIQEAYGYSQPRAVYFQPEPRDVSIYLDVLRWLVWYQNKYDKGLPRRDRLVPLFFAWSYGTPLWMLARQHQVSERTIERRRDDVAISVAIQFPGDIEKLTLDRVAVVRQKGDFTDIVADSRSDAPPMVREAVSTPAALRNGQPLPHTTALEEWRSHDAVLENLPGSEDRKQTIKKLNRNRSRADKLCRLQGAAS